MESAGIRARKLASHRAAEDSGFPDPEAWDQSRSGYGRARAQPRHRPRARSIARSSTGCERSSYLAAQQDRWRVDRQAGDSARATSETDTELHRAAVSA